MVEVDAGDPLGVRDGDLDLRRPADGGRVVVEGLDPRVSDAPALPMPTTRALGSMSRNVPIVVPVLLCAAAGTCPAATRASTSPAPRTRRALT